MRHDFKNLQGNTRPTRVLCGKLQGAHYLSTRNESTPPKSEQFSLSTHTTTTSTQLSTRKPFRINLPLLQNLVSATSWKGLILNSSNSFYRIIQWHLSSLLITTLLRIALWSGRGLQQRKLEVETFLHMNNIGDSYYVWETQKLRVKNSSVFNISRTYWTAHKCSAVITNCRRHTKHKRQQSRSSKAFPTYKINRA